MQYLSEDAVNSDLRERLARLFEPGALYRSVEAADGLAVGSVKGPVRQDNQDRAVVARVVRGPDGRENLTVAAVLDGMGGMADGAAAAALATSTFVADLVVSRGALRERFRRAVLRANSEVFERFAARGGTTLTAVGFDDEGNGCVAHVGDSRLYRLAPDRFTLITTDDTVEGVVRARSIQVSEDELDSKLIQFVGIGPDLDPHIFNVTDRPPAFWMLTSDGAHSLGRRLLQGIGASSVSAADLVRKLTFVADAAGLDDNATVVALHMPKVLRPQTSFPGTTLSIWTPSASVEIWFDPSVFERRGSAETGGKDRAAQNRPSQQLEQQSAKPPRKTKRRTKKGRSTIPDGLGDGSTDDGPAPQLNISFGEGRDPGRD